MSDNKLPQKFIDKIKHEIKSFDWKDITEEQAVSHCAQIAVDYAEEENAHMQSTFIDSMNLIRDENRELRELIINIIEEYEVFNKDYSMSLLPNFIEQAKQLLNKKEDGNKRTNGNQVA